MQLGFIIFPQTEEMSIISEETTQQLQSSHLFAFGFEPSGKRAITAYRIIARPSGAFGIIRYSQFGQNFESVNAAVLSKSGLNVESFLEPVTCPFPFFFTQV